MLTNIKYIHFNTPDYLDIQSHNKQLHLGPFQVLINVLNFNQHHPLQHLLDCILPIQYCRLYLKENCN